MSWVEDARKLMQNSVAPELRGINQRIDDLLTNMKSSFDAAEKLAFERGKAATERYSSLLERIESMRRELILQVDLALANRKIEELQARQQTQNAPQ